MSPVIGSAARAIGIPHVRISKFALEMPLLAK